MSEMQKTATVNEARRAVVALRNLWLELVEFLSLNTFLERSDYRDRRGVDAPVSANMVALPAQIETYRQKLEQDLLNDPELVESGIEVWEPAIQVINVLYRDVFRLARDYPSVYWPTSPKLLALRDNLFVTLERLQAGMVRAGELRPLGAEPKVAYVSDDGDYLLDGLVEASHRVPLTDCVQPLWRTEAGQLVRDADPFPELTERIKEWQAKDDELKQEVGEEAQELADLVNGLTAQTAALEGVNLPAEVQDAALAAGRAVKAQGRSAVYRAVYLFLAREVEAGRVPAGFETGEVPDELTDAVMAEGKTAKTAAEPDPARDLDRMLAQADETLLALEEGIAAADAEHVTLRGRTTARGVVSLPPEETAGYVQAVNSLKDPAHTLLILRQRIMGLLSQSYELAHDYDRLMRIRGIFLSASGGLRHLRVRQSTFLEKLTDFFKDKALFADNGDREYRQVDQMAEAVRKGGIVERRRGKDVGVDRHTWQEGFKQAWDSSPPKTQYVETGKWLGSGHSELAPKELPAYRYDPTNDIYFYRSSSPSYGLYKDDSWPDYHFFTMSEGIIKSAPPGGSGKFGERVAKPGLDVAKHFPDPQDAVSAFISTQELRLQRPITSSKTASSSSIKQKWMQVRNNFDMLVDEIAADMDEIRKQKTAAVSEGEWDRLFHAWSAWQKQVNEPWLKEVYANDPRSGDETVFDIGKLRSLWEQQQVNFKFLQESFLSRLTSLLAEDKPPERLWAGFLAILGPLVANTHMIPAVANWWARYTDIPVADRDDASDLTDEADVWRTAQEQALTEMWNRVKRWEGKLAFKVASTYNPNDEVAARINGFPTNDRVTAKARWGSGPKGEEELAVTFDGASTVLFVGLNMDSWVVKRVDPDLPWQERQRLHHPKIAANDPPGKFPETAENKWTLAKLEKRILDELTDILNGGSDGPLRPVADNGIAVGDGVNWEIVYAEAIRMVPGSVKVRWKGSLGAFLPAAPRTEDESGLEYMPAPISGVVTATHFVNLKDGTELRFPFMSSAKVEFDDWTAAPSVYVDGKVDQVLFALVQVAKRAGFRVMVSADDLWTIPHLTEPAEIKEASLKSAAETAATERGDLDKLVAKLNQFGYRGLRSEAIKVSSVAGEVQRSLDQLGQYRDRAVDAWVNLQYSDESQSGVPPTGPGIGHLTEFLKLVDEAMQVMQKLMQDIETEELDAETADKAFRGLWQWDDLIRRLLLFLPPSLREVADQHDITGKQQQVQKWSGSIIKNSPRIASDSAATARGDLHTDSDGEEFEPVTVTVSDISVLIEVPAGGTRSGEHDGQPWSHEHEFPYGEIPGTEGADGDPVDVILGPNEDPAEAFIIEQLDEMGEYDEDKVMLGFESVDEAEAAYDTTYADSPMERGETTTMPVGELTVDVLNTLRNGPTSESEHTNAEDDLTDGLDEVDHADES